MTDIIDELLEDYPDVDRKSCQLLGPTALITQGLMGVLVISSLILKRHRESPKRPWRIWLFDVSKQVIGQTVVHGVNVLISDLVAHASSGNACVFYFLNILIDTTIGVGLIYCILHFLTWLFSEKLNLKGFESGQYGTPPSFLFWARQAAVYIVSLLTMKLLVVGLFAAWPGILKIGEWLLDFLGPNDALQVVFTMGLFPIMMNVVQFWLIDSIVKSSVGVALPSQSPRTTLDGDDEPLFRASLNDDDYDDDDAFPQRHDIENPREHLPPQTPGDEPKSFVSSTAVGSSGSSTPAPKAIDIASSSVAGAQAEVPHAYPPSVASSSLTSSVLSTISSRAKSLSPKPKRRRRSPPPALALHPITPPAKAPVNRHLLSHRAGGGESGPGVEQALDEKDWAIWEDEEADDWAERVGEEEWTGTRLEARKGEVDDVWTRHAVSPNSP